MSTKEERTLACNELLKVIGGCGRRFFFHKPEQGDGRYARFELRRGAVYFVDDYSQKAIYTAWTRDDWRGFSHGGTLRDLVIVLAAFIRFGGRIAPSRFGPWPQWICGSDLWGYGNENMTKVRKAASNLGIVKFDNPAALDDWIQGKT